MKKYLLLPLVPFLVGCAFTQQGAIEEMAPLYMKQEQVQAETAKEVMKALANVKRGGMDIDLDSDGRVKSIHYREHLDMGVVKRALAHAQLPVPHAPAQDYAALFMGLGSVLTPIAGFYFNYKVNHDNTWSNAMVDMNQNWSRNIDWANFTHTYQNQSPAWPPEYMVPSTEPTAEPK